MLHISPDPFSFAVPYTPHPPYSILDSLKDLFASIFAFLTSLFAPTISKKLEKHSIPPEDHQSLCCARYDLNPDSTHILNKLGEVDVVNLQDFAIKILCNTAKDFTNPRATGGLGLSEDSAEKFIAFRDRKPCKPVEPKETPKVAAAVLEKFLSTRVHRRTA